VFVTFEGIEGAGKSTQVARLRDRLAAEGRDVLTTREPGGTPLGAALRPLVLHAAPGGAAPLAEAFLMLADRAEHVARVVRPALAAGRIVLCDRHADATIAYQGGGSGLDRAQLAAWNRAATGGLVPDLTVLLDLPPEEAIRRLAARGGTARDRFESEPAAFFDRVGATYRELAAAEPARWLVLDARRPVEEVAERIAAEIAERLRAGPRRELEKT
jgi:dTMP kinase